MSGKRQFADVGALMKGKDGGLYIKLEKDITITVKGKKYNGEEINITVEGGGYINLEKPLEKFEKIFKGDEAKIEERMEKIPDYLKYFASVSGEA